MSSEQSCKVRSLIRSNTEAVRTQSPCLVAGLVLIWRDSGSLEERLPVNRSTWNDLCMNVHYKCVYKHSLREGFTLIELAIVLVVIGIIIGSIFVGQGMIRDSQLKGVISEITRYKSAINAFHEEYHGIPGDIPNATGFWGVAGGNGTGLDTACYDALGSGTATCNGNDDGFISWNNGIPSSGVREDLRAWQHLYNAALIENKVTGTHTGTGGTCGFCVSLGVNIPRSKLNGAGYSLANLGTQTGNPQWYDASYGNVLFFGTPTSYTVGGILKGDEASLMDSKMDDGSPSSGRIVAWKSSINPGCTTTDVSATAAYNATNNNPVCALIIKTDW